MSQKKFNKKKLIYKLKNQITTINLLVIFLFILLTIPIVLIFVYALKRTWMDGLSVASIIYIGISLLNIIFNFANFKPISKIVNLFKIKKENNEQLTKFEQQQMKILTTNFGYKNKDNTKETSSKISFVFINYALLIYGILILVISLPFLY